MIPKKIKSRYSTANINPGLYGTSSIDGTKSGFLEPGIIFLPYIMVSTTPIVSWGSFEDMQDIRKKKIEKILGNLKEI